MCTLVIPMNADSIKLLSLTWESSYKRGKVTSGRRYRSLGTVIPSPLSIYLTWITIGSTGICFVTFQKLVKRCSISSTSKEQQKIGETSLKSSSMLSAKYPSKVSTESSIEIEDVSDESSFESRNEKYTNICKLYLGRC